ncbi:PQQ-dependent sugar dehydrogenase [Paenimyroides aestuarii]|uniref:PQQ-dependent sugar dehydrogenase n=1 Tax=Paenimyroides aestuarii TaxID=2968490 RepID=A0ABY5NPE9_9FLAO|nr:PQQ-dependent sugar dehydrogenase [Paenimyroides aestuarii]UUV20405.1 PQQ-dependent sugar dehydrogenase [Paenimyroides aestuarii]
MRKNFSFIPVFILLGIFSCNDDNANTATDETVQLGNPVETQPPHTTYKPAFEGQTRIGSVKTQTKLSVEVIAENIGRPWAIVDMPNGNLLVTDKNGYMKIFTENGILQSQVNGFPNVDNSGQGGMLDVALDPEFSSNRMIYWSFSEAYGNGNLTAVAKGKLSADEKVIENPMVIYRAEPSYDGSLHYGSRLAFDDAGNLYVSTGERSDLVTRPQAQALNSALGKIVRISKNGQPVSSNPFVADATAKPEIYSYGHRNPQGMAFHPVTKQLWEAEFGAMGGDEINFIEAGKNYGWPIISYGLEYNGSKIGEGITQKEGMEQPVYYWDPSISPSGIDFYTGNAVPEWQNNLFLGALSGQHIIRLVITNNKVAGEERLLADKNERFRDVLGRHQNQSLYAITDSGKIYKISKAK